MNIFSRFIKVYREENEMIREYFRDCLKIIDENNLYMLRKTCMYISMVYLVMFGIAYLMLPDFKISFSYLTLIPLLIIYFNVNLYVIKHQGEISTAKTAAICCTFYFWLGVVLSLMDVVASPNTQAIWLPIAVLVFPMIYIDRIYKYCFEEFVVLAIMLVMSYFYKTYEMFILDAHTAVSVYIVSILSAHIVLVMRSRETLAMTELTRLSSMDKLTKVLNKGALLQRIDSYFLHKPPEEPCAMCIIDLDDFKQVNDNLGHNIGDLLLEQVGKLLNENFRAYDIVGRYGGDEFVVVMPRMGDITILQMRCKTLQMYISSINFDNDKPFTVSIGAVVNTGLKDSGKMFAMADDALYKSKIQGKNCCTTWVYDEMEFNKPLILAVCIERHNCLKEIYGEDNGKFQIITALNDDDALCQISRYHSLIRVILLEVDQENGRGLLVVKYMKNRESFARIPIVVIAKDEESCKQAKKLGADEALMKDTPPAIYKKTINKLIGI